jgi:hypothetical protein
VIAPSDHFERFPGEIIKQSSRPLPRSPSAVFSLPVVHTNRDAVDERERLRVFSEHGCEVSCERRVRAFGSDRIPSLTTWFSPRGSLQCLSH